MPTGPRPTTPNVAEVTMQFKQDGQYLYNKHHFFDDAGWDEGRLNNLGTLIREWWNTNIKSMVANTVTLEAITCRDLSVASGLETAVTTGLPISGTNSFNNSPNSVTVAVKKATGRSGRAFHGRTYHVGLPANGYAQNTLTPGMVTALRDGYDALRNIDGPALEMDLVVLSEVVAGNWRPTGLATKVTGIAVDNVIDNQRRRLPGRGR